MNRFFTFVVMLTLALPAMAYSQTCTITFRVYTPENTPEDDQIFIPGNVSQLGNWDPDSVSLRKTNEGYHEITLVFPKGSVIEYKITRGSWMKEAMYEEGGHPSQQRIKGRER